MLNSGSEGQNDLPKFFLIESRMIHSYGYNAEKRILYLRFKSKPERVYSYRNFGPEKLELFLKAESKGKFCREEIKGKHGYENLGEIPL